MGRGSNCPSASYLGIASKAFIEVYPFSQSHRDIHMADKVNKTLTIQERLWGPPDNSMMPTMQHRANMAGQGTLGMCHGRCSSIGVTKVSQSTGHLS